MDPNDLPDYIDEVEALLKKYNTKYSMYAHAGAGELHVEPMVNLKTAAGKILFRNILDETTMLVKKYNGSLSGEHGDGRLRGEFIARRKTHITCGTMCPSYMATRNESDTTRHIL